MNENLKSGDRRSDQNKGTSSKGKGTIETKGPAKEKRRTVLHNDGSFAGLPNKEGKGSGALDGTVGRGM